MALGRPRRVAAYLQFLSLRHEKPNDPRHSSRRLRSPALSSLDIFRYPCNAAGLDTMVGCHALTQL